MRPKNYFVIFTVISFFLCIKTYSQNVPEILYYKFNTGTTTTPNLAIPGQGTPDAVITGQTLGPGGQFGNALLGNGGTGTPNNCNSGWNMNLGTSSWTISFWLSGIPATGTFYLFGNDITTSFRCFTNGAAGAGNITLQGNGLTTTNVTGVLPGSNVIHFVYDATLPAIKTYVNGVLQNTVTQTTPLNLNAAVPFKVGAYGTANSLPVGGIIDEFRFYSRALGQVEITSSWNVTLPVSAAVTNPTKICDYGLIPQYSAGVIGGNASATLGDTLYSVGGSVNPGTQTNPPAGTTVVRYAINSGIWSSGRDLPSAKVGGNLVKCGSSLYYIGGGNVTLTGASDNLCYKYSPATGWSSITNIPTPVTGNVAESWGDSVVFCIMGGWSSYYRGIQIYRPGSNTWDRATESIPATFGRRSFAGGLDGNKIFVASGYSGAFRKDFWVGTIGANANSITWSQKTDMPMRGTNSRPGGHAVNGRFYVVLGETTPGLLYQDSIQIYNIADSSWLSTPLTGRGLNSASNYWGLISSSIVNNKVKIWIPGGFYPTTVTTSKLFCLTDSLGCITTGTGSQNTILPERYNLSQNYPNPFNPTTRIIYSIPVTGLVKLRIFDILGKEVMTLVNELKTAGDYGIDLDGRNLSSGIYFYKLEAGDFSSTKKMMLVK